MAKKLFTRTRSGNARVEPEGRIVDDLSVPIDGTQSFVDGNGNPSSGDDNASEFIDPAGAASGNGARTDSGDGTRRKRGRPRGSSNGSAPNKRSETSRNLDSILFSIHTMGAIALKTPELMITEDESKQLASAINRVTELYDIPILSEKSMAWMGLAMAAGTVYGPRLMAAKMNAKKPEMKKPQTSTIPFVAPKPVNVATPPVNQQVVNDASFVGWVETDPIEVVD